MTNLPVPTLPNEIPGNYIASAVFNTVGLNGLGFALNPPCAILQQATAQSIATGLTLVPVTYDTESLDTYGGHSVTTNTSRYVGQVPGYYLVIGSVCYTANATGNRLIQIEKNGAAIGAQQVFQSPTTSNSGTVQAAGIVQLNGTIDYVEAYTVQTSGGSLTTVPANSSMYVVWIHA